MFFAVDAYTWGQLLLAALPRGAAVVAPIVLAFAIARRTSRALAA